MSQDPAGAAVPHRANVDDRAAAVADVMVGATSAAAATAVVALLVLLASLFWPGLQRPGLLVLLAVPLVRNAVLVFGARTDRGVAFLGSVLLVVVYAATWR
jgi:hypothetical protein